MKGLRYLMFFCLISLTIIVGLDYHGGKIVTALPDNIHKETEIEIEPLPTVGSHENLIKSLEEARPVNNDLRMAYGAAIDNRQEAATAPEQAANALQDGNSVNSEKVKGSLDFSQTNVQVQGVDEADTVKTDGEYIYKITNNKVIVAKAYPAEEMKIISTLDFGRENNPVEMYVDSKYLTVILNKSYYHLREVYSADSGGIVPDKKIMPSPPFENSVQVFVYDLGDRTNLKQVREVEIDGSYVSSRKTGSNLYLVNNKYIQIHLLKEQSEALIAPAYKDSADGGEINRIGYEEIRYFPGSPEANFLIIAGINLDTLTDKKTEVKTYLGAGQSIYSSLENLFVAVPESKYHQVEPIRLPEPVDTSASSPASEADRIMPGDMPLPMPRVMPIEENTRIYKFGLQDGNTEYLGKGSVPGRILNQFSMDEHNGYFRIATTEQEYDSNQVKMTNNLFILDQEMKLAGKLENIAPNEKIYSVRFLGDRGYMVTFKTVDPLFVLDLKDPNNPEILGELKIPGYSNYLHPYDENHIIGFGKEAVEVEEPHWSGQGTVKNAYYLGMKIALFDVSDVNNPKEKFKVEIGDRGTESELFQNHKALLFSKEKNFMAFPVTVCDIDPAAVNKNDYLVKKDPRLAYGQPVFQGAFVYNLSLDKGFELKGMITHQPPGKLVDIRRTGQYDHTLNISRSLYIGDTLYTISDGYLKANDLTTLGEIGGIQILNGI